MLPINTDDGLFVDGNPVTGALGTPVTATWANAVQAEVLAVIEAADLVPAADNTQLLQAIHDLIATATAGVLPKATVATVPTASVGDQILVTDAEEIWSWVNTAYFTGYRSHLCGRAIFGHTSAPLPNEFDAVGGTMSKTAYAAVWAYAQENGLVKASGDWVAGAHWFVDLGGDNFMAPDLRQQFASFRAGAVDPDTANARTLGSYKADTIKSHTHPSWQRAAADMVTGGPSQIYNGVQATTTGATGTAETAPCHTAYAPRIHV